VEAEWELLDGRMEEGQVAHTAAVHSGVIYAVDGSYSPDTGSLQHNHQSLDGVGWR
jgi:hypothetical protein